MIGYKSSKEMELKNKYPKMFRRPLSAIKKTDYNKKYGSKEIITTIFYYITNNIILY